MRALVLLAVLATGPALAQPANRCQSDDAAGLDFWVGTWDLAWERGGAPGGGTNTVTREHNGCVVHERFEDAMGYAGESWSVRTPAGWRQTWVDNAGGYLVFEGTTDAAGRVTEMRTPPFQNPAGQTQVSRMVWEDVTDEGLVWRWQASTDDGTTWADRWVIHYTRAEG